MVKGKNLSLWRAIKKTLVDHILMKFLLQAYGQIQTSQIIKESGCSTKTAFLSGGSRFEDN